VSVRVVVGVIAPSDDVPPGRSDARPGGVRSWPTRSLSGYGLAVASGMSLVRMPSRCVPLGVP
jgi:hypothetical protein